MRRVALSVLLLIGVGLIVAPVSMSMYSRANDGQKMMNDFNSLMQPAHVQKTADYYYNTFTKLRPIALAMNQQTVDRFNNYMKGFAGMQTDGQKLVPALAKAMHMTPAQVQQLLATQFPSMAQMLANLPQMQKDFGGLMGMMASNVDTFKNVPPGLDWYKPLVETMKANTGTYASVNALPAFGTFFWFFVIPGILIILAAAYLLVGDINPSWVWPRLPTTPKPLAH